MWTVTIDHRPSVAHDHLDDALNTILSSTLVVPLSVGPTPGSDWVLVTLIWALLLGSLT